MFGAVGGCLAFRGFGVQGRLNAFDIYLDLGLRVQGSAFKGTRAGIEVKTSSQKKVL